MQLSHSKDILFIDKDGTMGNLREIMEGPFDCYPGLRDFLTQMRELRRRIYVATRAGEGGLNHLAAVQDLLSGYFGNEEIGSIDTYRYVDENRRVRRIEGDFVKGKDKMSKGVMEAMDTTQEKIWAEIKILRQRIEENEHQTAQNEAEKDDLERSFAVMQLELERQGKRSEWISKRLERQIHVQTGFPLARSALYKNPYLPNSYPLKDLHLARLRIAPRSPGSLRCVMIGDGSDKDTVASDPLTPLIVISEKVRSGKWHLVKSVVDQLFSSPGVFPHQQFEAMIQAANKGIWTSSEGHTFTLQRGTLQERRIYCP